MNGIFTGIFDTTTSMSITLEDFFICMAVAIILGVFMAKMYSYKERSSKGFVVTLALLPIAVTMVIIMVNGNIGAGVAVAGAFSLVRFRSMPGTAKEIIAIFTAMCTGLTIGMGYIGFAVLFCVIACGFSLVLNATNFGEEKENGSRTLQITIPESLNYTNVFDDIFKKFTKKSKLIAAKTTNMGSLFKLTYEVELKDVSEEKLFIDEIRTRNGNLEIVIGKNEIFINGL